MPDLTIDLRGKGVIVTAAGGRIGSVCALALARCWASLALNDVDAAALDRSVARVRELGATATPIVGDVSDDDTVPQMASTALDRLGNIFGLVNIAGTSMPKPIMAAILLTRDG